MSDPYRVSLDVYNGPLDLLLYLIRRSEIDIYDIPIAVITEQYLSYLDAIRMMEPAVAGDFLVLAATLMEIKSRTMLPTPPAGEEEDVEDPRNELVRQLLAYKQFKDAAGWLGDQAESRAERLGRLGRERVQVPDRPEGDDAGLKDVELWDLVEAFGRLMRETLSNMPEAIVDEDVPVQVITDGIINRLRQEEEVPFTRLFDGVPSRRHVAGVFLAILELVRLRRIRAVQERPFGEILIRLRGPEIVGADAQPS